MPQGSVQGPLLFKVFINDLPECVSKQTVFKLFADDSKLLTTVYNHDDRLRLQSDLLNVGFWTRSWLMELNFKKCTFIQFTSNRSCIVEPYFMEEYDTFGVSERNLEVQITSDLKKRDQVILAAAKANRILGTLKSTFTSRDSNLWK